MRTLRKFSDASFLHFLGIIILDRRGQEGTRGDKRGQKETGRDRRGQEGTGGDRS